MPECRSEADKGIVSGKLEMFCILIVAVVTRISCQNSLTIHLKSELYCMHCISTNSIKININLTGQIKYIKEIQILNQSCLRMLV